MQMNDTFFHFWMREKKFSEIISFFRIYPVSFNVPASSKVRGAKGSSISSILDSYQFHNYLLIIRDLIDSAGG